MASPFVKGKLKTARDAIGKKDFNKARDAATDVLTYEPDNYNANVFLGLALSELGDIEASEQAYQKAIDANSEQVLAWQGICKLYERRKDAHKYPSTMEKLMQIYAKSDDASKCGEVLQKYIEYRRQSGTQSEVISALSYLLPSSPFYSILSSLPPPDPSAPTSTTIFDIQSAVHNTLPVVEEIVGLTEKIEKDTFNKEFDKRRTRLNAGTPAQIKKILGLEIWSKSKLPDLYGEVIGHPNTSDDRRREAEAKLLQFKYQYLCALSTSDPLKKQLASEVQALTDGVVLLGIPNEQAWTLYLDGQNCDTIDDYDFDNLRRMFALFPNSSLSRLIFGFLVYSGFPTHEQSEDKRSPVEIADDEDPFDLVVDSFANVPDSIFAHRTLGQMYIDEEEYQNAISVAEKGLQLVRKVEADLGKSLEKTQKAFNVIIGTALVHLYPPRHHARAIRILDDVLSIDPTNKLALMGRGLIMQAAKRWKDAASLFLQVYNRAEESDTLKDGALEEHAWCILHDGEADAAITELQQVRDNLDDVDGNGEAKARIWWRLGECFWRSGDASREDAYKHYITALKHWPTYAPAFTSLGIYYLESDTPDPKRASKCFQKAFELDARETEAARRLADGFAEEREWDLVEVVAKRTIEGEGGLGGGFNEAAVVAGTRGSATNVWAWKAMGVVDLNNRKYPSAIQAFQVALRSDDDDALSWLRLSEAYVGAGRYAAALKALTKSHELNPDDWVCTYQIGEVLRQTGQLAEAIESFESVLASQSKEMAVLMALSETYLQLGRVERTSGFIGRSTSSFLSSILVAKEILDSSPGFRRLAWKTIADCLYEISEDSILSDPQAVAEQLGQIETHLPASAKSVFDGLVSTPLAIDTELLGGRNVLYFAIACCNARLSSFSKEEKGIGSAYFDLGVGLFRLSGALESVRAQASKTAIEHVRTALLSDPTNSLYWNTFGNMHFVDDSTVAQHSYIKALEFSPKDAAIWTNLGLLYLQNNDAMLANEAFYKAQILDPDYTMAWVGQGLVAIENGHDQDADALLEHAISLTSDMPEADFEFAFRVFKQLPNNIRSVSQQERLLVPFFSLDRFCRRRSGDPTALNLFALVCERLHQYDLAVQTMSKAIKILEAIYEETEDAVIEHRYAIANANLGRIQLASGDPYTALETFETAIGLLAGENEEAIALRSMCRFGAGIAHVHLNNFSEAIPSFEQALEIAESSSSVRPQVTVMLAQALWAVGTDEFRESAKSHLLACIGEDPQNLTAVVVLAAMGLLTDDEDLIDAALSEIMSLSIDVRHARDPEGAVEDILSSHFLAEGNTSKASSVLQQAIHAEPWKSKPRCEMASLCASTGEAGAAQALLQKLLDRSIVTEMEGMHHALRLSAIVHATTRATSLNDEAEAQRSSQRAVHLAPWDTRNWLCLAYVENLI
ncbi:TPR-like protein [Schizopora paradoxa]|uniref:TPR-like protein n=1 Tax=Schizopora paradoxa TaxID=27342 RepID=A0A0H2SCR6_9AGAM|nr:TPR-like protein [Schizopora paradoxa]